MKELLNIMRRRRSKWCMPLVGAVSVAVIIGSIWLNVAPFSSGFENWGFLCSAIRKRRQTAV